MEFITILFIVLVTLCIIFLVVYCVVVFAFLGCVTTTTIVETENREYASARERYAYQNY